MQMELVSKKLLILCLACSTLILFAFFFVFISSNSVLYICNEKDSIDIYEHINGEDVIIKPQNFKNVLMCLGRGMPFYDRRIERIEGPVSYTIQKELSSRYIVVSNNRQVFLNGNNSCILGKKHYLIIQKNIVMDSLLQNIDQCKPDSIIVSSRYKDSGVLKALQSHKYMVTFIDNGEYKRLLL